MSNLKELRSRIASVTSTQLQATQLSFFVFLPSVMLSGFMFPFETMPTPIQWLGELLPLTHYIRLVRGIFLRGAFLAELAGSMAALAAFTSAPLSAAILNHAAACASSRATPRPFAYIQPS